MEEMLKVLATAISISVFACLAFGQGKGLTGRWEATLEKGGRSMTSIMNLRAPGNQVIGAIELAPHVTVQIRNGNAEGGQLTFDVTAPEHGRTKEVHFVGDVADDTITLRNEIAG